MKTTISALCLLLFFVSCNKSAPKESSAHINSKFVTVWFDTAKGVPFTEKLEIKQNGTFNLVGAACTASWSSEGNWIIENDTIILNSVKPKECVYINEYGTRCKTRDEIMKNGSVLSSKECDTTYRYPDFEVFKNEKFYFKNDSLVHVKQNKKCEGITIVYSNKEKKHR